MGVTARPPPSPVMEGGQAGEVTTAHHNAAASTTVLPPQLPITAVIQSSSISHLSSFSHDLSRSLPTHIGIVSVSVNSKKSVNEYWLKMTYSVKH